MTTDYLQTIATHWDTALLAYLATMLQVLGFLFRQQIILRLLVLGGSAAYVSFYYFHPAQPLWDAIIGSSLIGLANAIGLAMLIYSRMPMGMSDQERHVYDALGGLEPGLFRKLMSAGRLRDTRAAVQLTCQGQRADTLCYVLQGRPQVRKDDVAFRIGDRVFIGELGYMMDSPASATVDLPQGGIFVEWDRHRLKRLCARSPSVRVALDALISRDMAGKVYNSVQRAAYRPAAPRSV